MDEIPDVAQELRDARQALMKGHWDEARRLFKEISTIVPGHPDAQHGLDRLDGIGAVDHAVCKLRQRADKRFRARAYQEAFDLYVQALSQASEVGILKYHADLERGRNLARDLAGWQKRIQEALTEARRRGDEGNWSAAWDNVTSLLKELPRSPDYEAMAEQIREVAHEAEQAMDDQAIHRRALDAFQSRDLDETIRLLSAFPHESPLYGEAQSLLNNASGLLRMVQPALDKVTAALQEGRWAEASDELGHFSEEDPDNPAWQRLRLEMGIVQGQQELEQGRQAHVQWDFETALSHFERARDAFTKVLKADPTHVMALTLNAEAVDLTEIAVEEGLAQADWQTEQRQKARTTLEQSLRRVERAKVEGRDYATAGAIAKVMHQTIEDEIQRIQEAESWLEEGERLLTDRKLQEAARKFHEAANALLTDQRDRAVDGLGRIEAEKQHFEEEVEQGKTATDPFTAVEAIRAAYNRWPTGPGMPGTLTDALLRAGAASLENGNEGEASTLCQQVLRIDRDNVQAKRILDRIALEPQIGATVQRAQDELKLLLREEDINAEAFDPILVELSDALSRLQDLPGLNRVEIQAKKLYTEVQAHRERWQQYERLYHQAEEYKQAGKWEQAIERFEEALAALGKESPPPLRQRLGDWKAAQDVIVTAWRNGSEALQQAQSIYSQAFEPDNVEDLLAALALCEEALQQAEGAVQAASGVLPDDLDKLSHRFSILREQAGVVQRALATTSASDGLLIAQQGLQQWRNDKTLQALQQYLQKRAIGEADGLLRQANLALEEGALTEALDLLRQARELDPDNAKIIESYTALQRRQRLEDKLRRIETDCATKLGTNSLVDACNSLRQGLDIFLDPETDSPVAVREALLDLVQLSGREEFAFGLDEHWPEAQGKLAELGRLGTQGWSAQQAYRVAEQWVRLSRDIALRGVVQSTAQLGNMLGSYRAAVTYRNAHTDPKSAQFKEAVEQEAAARERLIARSNESVARRLNRAQEALQRGGFEVALNDLADIEERIYGPIEREFPGLLEGYDTVESQKADAKRLEGRARQMQVLYGEVQPRLKAAEMAFLDEQFGNAEGELRGIPDLKDVPPLAKAVDELQQRISRARAHKASQKLGEVLTTSRVRLRLATTLEEFAALLECLEELQRQVDWGSLSPDQHNDYYYILDEVRGQRDSLLAGVKWEETADKAEAQGDYIQATAALGAALTATKDSEKRVTLQARLSKMQDLAKRQKERQEAEQEGRDLLGQGNYIGASEALRRAESLGASVPAWLLAARAGALLAGAHRAVQDDKDWEGAHWALEQCLSLASQSPEATAIATEARSLQSVLSKQQQTQESAEAKLHAAGLALAAGDLQMAREEVQAVLDQTPGHPVALEVQKQIQCYTQAQTMLREAQAAREADKFDDALSILNRLLDSVLPDFPEAISLKQQVELELGVKDTLAQAERLARAHKFRQADAALQKAEASGADPNRLEQVRDSVTNLETEWGDDRRGRIQEFAQKEKYAEALKRCRQVLSQVASQNLTAEFESLQRDIVNRWAKSEIGMLQQRLQEATDEAQFIAIAFDLDQLSATEPQPETRLLREIERLRRKAHEQRLERHLDNIAQKDDKGKWRVVVQPGDQGRWLGTLGLLNSVREEAESLQLVNLVFQTINLIRDLETTGRERFVSKAQKMLSNPTQRADLEQARESVRQVLAVSRFEKDREATALLEEIEEQLRLYDDSEAAIKRSSEMIFLGRFEDADRATRRLEVSPICKDRYEQQRSLAKMLRRADRDKELEDWAAALSGYRRAIEQEPKLERLLDRRVEDCRSRLMESLLLQAQEELEAVPPRPEQARELLRRGQEDRLTTPAYQGAVTFLEERIVRQEKVVKAISILEQERNAKEALDLLAEVRRSLSDEESDVTIRQLEYLAQAIQAQQVGDWDRVRELLQFILPPVAGFPRVQQLHDELARAGAASRVLKNAQDQVETALQTSPPQHQEAVTVVIDTLKAVGDKACQLQLRVRTQLEDLLETARDGGRYAEAIAVASSICRLAPEDVEARQLLRSLLDERRERLDQVLNQAEEAIAADEMETVKKTLKQAMTIAEPEGDPRLDILDKRWLDRLQILEQVDNRLGEVRLAIKRKEWESAIETLLEIRRDAPQYPRLVEIVTQLQNQLHGLISAHQKHGEFTKALLLCSLALRIGAREDLQELQGQIEGTLKARLDEVCQQVEHAFEAWDLEMAEEALAQGLAVEPLEPRLLTLQTQRQEMVGLAPTLRDQMEIGWEALKARDYSKAKQAFGQVLIDTPNFGEAQLWRDYTFNLEQAVQAEQSDRIRDLLKQAESRLRLQPGERLPSMLPNALERRRQAVWDAYQLWRIAARLAELSKEQERLLSEVAINPEAVRQARRVLDDIERDQQYFSKLHQSPTLVSRDFSIESANAVQAPVETPSSDSSASARSDLDS